MGCSSSKEHERTVWIFTDLETDDLFMILWYQRLYRNIKYVFVRSPTKGDGTIWKKKIEIANFIRIKPTRVIDARSDTPVLPRPIDLSYCELLIYAAPTYGYLETLSGIDGVPILASWGQFNNRGQPISQHPYWNVTRINRYETFARTNYAAQAGMNMSDLDATSSFANIISTQDWDSRASKFTELIEELNVLMSIAIIHPKGILRPKYRSMDASMYEPAYEELHPLYETVCKNPSRMHEYRDAVLQWHERGLSIVEKKFGALGVRRTRNSFEIIDVRLNASVSDILLTCHNDANPLEGIQNTIKTILGSYSFY